MMRCVVVVVLPGSKGQTGGQGKNSRRAGSYFYAGRVIFLGGQGHIFRRAASHSICSEETGPPRLRFRRKKGEIEVCSSILGPLRWSGGHRREIVFSGGNAQL